MAAKKKKVKKTLVITRLNHAMQFFLQHMRAEPWFLAEKLEPPTGELNLKER